MFTLKVVSVCSTTSSSTGYPESPRPSPGCVLRPEFRDATKLAHDSAIAFPMIECAFSFPSSASIYDGNQDVRLNLDPIENRVRCHDVPPLVRPDNGLAAHRPHPTTRSANQ
jgi:hypothetical protein